MIINKTAYLAIANVIAIAILALGLLSPLTPSEGTPGLLEIVVFAGSPLAILSFLIYKTKNKIAKLLFITEIAAISSILFHILRTVFK